jgi:hypothetical protein
LAAGSTFAPSAGAQAIGTLVVNAPRVILTAGESMRLRAGARDNQGNRVPGGVYQWASSNPGVATVDGTGVVTAAGIGVTNVTVRSGSIVSPAVALQILPLRIEISSDTNEIVAGQTIQFSASPVDINGQALPVSTIAWSVTGPNGNGARSATIDTQGVFTAYGAGLVTVHAAVTFSGQSAAQIARFENLAHVRINAPIDYTLTRWLATDSTRRTFTIRPSFMSEISANDSGQIAVVANLQGLSNALMLFQNGRFDVLASAGRPAARPVTYINQLESPPSINDAGQVVVRYTGYGESGLLLASTAGVQLLPEGSAVGSLQRMSGFRVSKFSLNASGDVLFLAGFTFEGARTANTGLFRSVNGNIVLIWSNSDPLPDLSAGYSFDIRDFGHDNAGNVYFTVQAPAGRMMYRITETRGVEKIAGPGTVAGGYLVQSVNRLVISKNGNFAYSAALQAGNQALVRVRTSDSSTEVQRLLNFANLLGIADSGEVFWSGDPGSFVTDQRGWGLWRWPSSGASVQVIPWGTPFNGAGFNWARSGAITSKGELFADISTPGNDLLVVRPETATILFGEGTVVEAEVALNFQGLVPGASQGPIHLFTGSGNAAVMQALPNELKPVWIPGDRFAGFPSSYVANFAAKDPTGEALYLSLGSGIGRFRANRFEPLLTFPITFPVQQSGESLTITGNSAWYNGSLAFAANRSGSFAWNANAGTHNRLMLYDRGQLSSLMAQGGPNPTGSPGGGRFTGIASGYFHQNTVAIDERGRVFVNAAVSGGPSGLFLYENGRWNAAALFGNTRIEGEIVNGAIAIHSGEDRFYALLDLAGGRGIAEYDGQQWKMLVARSQVTPDGMDIGNFGALLSVNRRGGIAFLATGTRSRIVTRTPDGKLHVVYAALDKTDSGDMLWPAAYFGLQYHDDGRVYFAGLDTLDRNTFYVAEPRF